MLVKSDSLGITRFAPELWAASAMPLSAKQLSGLLIGLSVTATDAAPAFRHNRVTSASSSGLVVAQREGGVAKAAFTFIRTLSPLFT